MINEMLKMQRALDDAIYNEHNVEFDDEKCMLAMIDEIGEFNHEVKSTWCWWKKSQEPIDRDKALEELVDIWHFALSLTYHYDAVYFCEEENEYEPETPLSVLYNNICCVDGFQLIALILLGLRFGFSLEDVYEAYKKKNKVNFERLNKGY